MFFQGVNAHETLLGSKCSYGCCGLVVNVQNFVFKSYSNFTGDTKASIQVQEEVSQRPFKLIDH